MTSGAISTLLWTRRRQRRQETQPPPENPGRFTHRAISTQAADFSIFPKDSEFQPNNIAQQLFSQAIKVGMVVQ